MVDAQRPPAHASLLTQATRTARVTHVSDYLTALSVVYTPRFNMHVSGWTTRMLSFRSHDSFTACAVISPVHTETHELCSSSVCEGVGRAKLRETPSEVKIDTRV